VFAEVAERFRGDETGRGAARHPRAIAARQNADRHVRAQRPAGDAVPAAGRARAVEPRDQAPARRPAAGPKRAGTERAARRWLLHLRHRRGDEEFRGGRG